MLKVTDLRVKYGKAQAVNNVSFHVDEGSIVAILGSNGAGKTTTLKALSGLIKSVSGSRIELSGKNITSMPAHKIVRLGMSHVPEGRKIFGKLTVKQNLIMGAYTRRADKTTEQDIAHCFSLFPRLEERANQYAGTLSGGEQQMLAIARAMMSKPKLLLLDEPSMGLAPVIVEKIYEKLIQINKENKTTLVIVEQNANLVMEVCDYAYVIAQGEITLHGSKKELMTNQNFITAYLGYNHD